MKKTFLAMTAILFGYSVFAQNTNQLLSNYINIKNALINSDTKSASEAIAILHKNIIKENSFAQNKDLKKAVSELAEANNIEKQRNAFSDVSNIIWKLVKKTESLTQDVYYQYCPMKKAYWLSTEKEIKNPYYGSAMLNCGKVVETRNSTEKS
ncbi:MAG: DUF3347 domain-containing protein [Bacteroidetes bacterium]|nr:DUF3347 domain-containing protein [Bacteroidota bacterium]